MLLVASEIFPEHAFDNTFRADGPFRGTSYFHFLRFNPRAFLLCFSARLVCFSFADEFDEEALFVFLQVSHAGCVILMILAIHNRTSP